MKTTLTLNAGSFFFLGDVSLVRGIPSEVDLTQLDDKTLKALHLYTASGQITSTEAIPAVAAKHETPVTLEPVVEVVTEEEEEPLEKMTVKELLEVVKERGIETDAKTRKELLAILKA